MKPENMRPEQPDAGASPVLHPSAERPTEVSLSPDSTPANPQLSTSNSQPSITGW